MGDLQASFVSRKITKPKHLTSFYRQLHLRSVQFIYAWKEDQQRHAEPNNQTKFKYQNGQQDTKKEAHSNMKKHIVLL